MLQTRWEKLAATFSGQLWYFISAVARFNSVNSNAHELTGTYARIARLIDCGVRIPAGHISAAGVSQVSTIAILPIHRPTIDHLISGIGDIDHRRKTARTLIYHTIITLR